MNTLRALVALFALDALVASQTDGALNARLTLDALGAFNVANPSFYFCHTITSYVFAVHLAYSVVVFGVFALTVLPSTISARVTLSSWST